MRPLFFFYQSLNKRQMRAFETDEGGPEKQFIFYLALGTYT